MNPYRRLVNRSAFYLILAATIVPRPGSAAPEQDISTIARRLSAWSREKDRAKLATAGRKGGPLADLFLLRAALLAEAAGHPSEALALASEVPAGPATPRALATRVRCLTALGRVGEASRLAATSPLPLMTPEAELAALKAEVRALDRSDPQGAISRLVAAATVRRRTPARRHALGELALRYRTGRFLPRPSAPARLIEYARLLLDEKEYAEAVAVTGRVIGSPKISTPGELAEARLLLAKVHLKRNETSLAGALLAAASGEPELPDAPRSEALYLRGDLLKRSGDFAGARALYDQVVELGGPQAGAALWQLADLDTVEGGPEAGDSRLRHLAKAHPESYFAPQGLWKIAVREETAGRPTAAGEAYLAFVKAFPHHRQANTARYLAAEAFARAGAADRAEALWTACLESPPIPDLDSLFSAQRLAGVALPSLSARKGPGWKAFLAQVAHDAQAQPRWIEPGPAFPADSRPRIAALREAGLLEDLAAELEYWKGQPEGRDFGVRAALSWTYYQLGRFRDSIGAYETVLAERLAWPASARGAIQSGMYSRGYPREVKAASLAHGVPESMVLAIAREESHFDRFCQSSSDARGLMQVLPSTARWIAKERKRRAPKDLYDAAVSLDYGTWYLRWLKARFDRTREPEALVMAGYNGGPGNTARWLAARPESPLSAFIESLDREETRFYIRKVSRSLLMYEALEELASRPTVVEEVPPQDETGKLGDDEPAPAEDGHPFALD